MLIIDAHEDLAYNMLTFGRDYTRSALATRQQEASGPVPARNGETLLGWPEYRRGRVAVVFGTLFAAPARWKEPWEKLFYQDTAEAHRLYNTQLDVYYRLTDEHPDQFQLIRSRRDLQLVLERWQSAEEADARASAEMEAKGPVQEQDPEKAPPPGPPVGIVVLMEGAEGVRAPGELEEWWGRGVRLIGPAWAGTRFCGGTNEPGPLTGEGFALLEVMGSLGFGLDISHMDEKAALQALDMYAGPIAATHANVLRLLKGVDSNRHLSDPVIQAIIARDGVIGIVPFNSFLLAGWRRGDRRDPVSLSHVVAHIDTICQIAGDARHVGLGTDFDGGFGVQSTPVGIDTIADLQKLVPLLAEKGYSADDIAAILGGNWRTHLTRILPETA